MMLPSVPVPYRGENNRINSTQLDTPNYNERKALFSLQRLVCEHKNILQSNFSNFGGKSSFTAEEVRKSAQGVLDGIKNLILLLRESPSSKMNVTEPWISSVTIQKIKTRKIECSYANFLEKSKEELRIAFDLLLRMRNLSYADHLLDTILALIPTLPKSASIARKWLLEMMPYCIEYSTCLYDDLSYSNSETKIKECHSWIVHDKIVKVLKSLLLYGDISFQSIFPVLRFIRLDLVKDRVLDICIDSLNIVRKEEFPILVKSIFTFVNISSNKYINDNEKRWCKTTNQSMKEIDYQDESLGKCQDQMICRVIEAVRHKWEIVESEFLSGTPNNIHKRNIGERKPSNSLVLMGEILVKELLNSPSFAKSYVLILQRHFLEMSDQIPMHSSDKWLSLDLIAMLILFHHHSALKQNMKEMIHCLCCQLLFPFKPLVEKLICVHQIMVEGRNSVLYSYVSPSLISLCLYLFMIPIYLQKYPLFNGVIVIKELISFEKCIKYNLCQAHEFLIILYEMLGKEHREEICKSLLILSSSDSLQSLLASAIDNTCTTFSMNHNEYNSYNKFEGVIHSRLKTGKILEKLPWPIKFLFNSHQAESNPNHLVRHIYQISISILSVLSSLLEHLTYRKDFRGFKHVFVDRLLAMSRCSSLCRDKAFSLVFNDISLDDGDYFSFSFHNHIIRMNCVILLSIEENIHYNDIENRNQTIEYKNGNPVDLTDTLMLIQKSLLSNLSPLEDFDIKISLEYKYNFDKDLPYNFQRFFNQNIIIGINLAMELVRSPSLSKVQRYNVLHWVLRILSSQKKEQSGRCGIRSVNGFMTIYPYIGYWVIQFLRSVCSEFLRQDMRHGFIRSRASLFSAPEIFNHVKELVVETGLIQLEATSNNDSERLLEEYSDLSNKAKYILGYKVIPKAFDRREDAIAKKKRKRMVFCVSSFLSHFNLIKYRRESEIHVRYCFVWWIRYVDILIDTYLKLGRIVAKTKWCPDSWLLALLQFPIPQAKTRNIDFDDRLELQIDHLFQNNHIECQIIDIPESYLLNFMKIWNYDIKHGASLFCYISACIFSIILYNTVLNNVFEHYQVNVAGRKSKCCDISHDETILGFMQFHIAKIYDLRRRYLDILEILLPCHVCNNPSSKYHRESYKSNHMRVVLTDTLPIIDDFIQEEKRDILTTEIPDIRYNGAKTTFNIIETLIILPSKIFNNRLYFAPDILLRCLPCYNDDIYFKIISNHFPQEGYDKWNDVVYVISLSCSIISHVHDIMECEGHDDYYYLRTESTTIKEGLLLPSKSTIFSNFYYFHNTAEPVNEEDILIIVNTLNMIMNWKSYLDLHHESFSLKEWNIGNIPYIEFYKDFIMSLNQSLSAGYRLLNHLCKKCMTLNSRCNVWPLPDLISISTEHNKLPSLSHYVSNLIVEHLSLCYDALMACQLLDLLSIISNSDYANDVTHDASWKTLIGDEVVTKQLQHSCLDKDWTASVLPMSFIYTVLRCLLSQKLDMNKQTVPQMTLGTMLKAALEVMSSEDDDDNFRRKLLSHWGLFGGRGPVLYDDFSEILKSLHHTLVNVTKNGVKTMSITTISSEVLDNSNRTYLSFQGLTSKSIYVIFHLTLNLLITSFTISYPVSKVCPTMKQSPYHEIEKCGVMIGKLLGLFTCYIDHFPMSSHTAIVISCSLMISGCKYQVASCIEWRDLQSILCLTSRDENNNLTDKNHLRLLIQSMMVHCTDIISCICHDIKALLTKIPYSKNIKEITTLSENCEELVAYLNETLTKGNIESLGSHCCLQISNENDEMLYKSSRKPEKENIVTESSKKIFIEDHYLSNIETENIFTIDSDQDSFGVLGTDWGGEEDGSSELHSELSHIPEMP